MSRSNSQSAACTVAVFLMVSYLVTVNMRINGRWNSVLAVRSCCVPLNWHESEVGNRAMKDLSELSSQLCLMMTTELWQFYCFNEEGKFHSTDKIVGYSCYDKLLTHSIQAVSSNVHCNLLHHYPSQQMFWDVSEQFCNWKISIYSSTGLSAPGNKLLVKERKLDKGPLFMQVCCSKWWCETMKRWDAPPWQIWNKL